MRYLAIAVLSALGGFIAAWWMLSPVTGEAPVQERTDALPLSYVPRVPITTTTAEGETAPLRFEDIDTGATVFDQIYIATQLAAEADTYELEALLDRAIAHPDPFYVYNITTLLLERYTALDPDAAMAYVTSNPRLDQIQMQGHVLTSWIRNDPDGALAYFREISDQELRNSIGGRLLSDSTLAGTGILDEVSAIVGPQAEQMRQQIEMYRTDPVQLFETAMASSNPDRGRELQYALGRWLRQDPEAALARVNSIPSDVTRKSLMRLALIQYAQQNAEAALTFLQINDPGNAQLEGQILAIMAQQNIEHALPLVEEFIERTGNDDPLGTVLSTWARRDPQAALAYLRTFDLSEHFDLYVRFAMQFGSSNPGAAIDWAVGLDAGEMAPLRSQVFSMVAYKDAALLEQALSRTTDDAIRGDILKSIARAQAQSDPMGAMQWLESYRREPAYAAAYTEVLQQIAHDQPESAARLFDESVADPRMNSIAGAIAMYWARGNQDAALQWVNELRSNELRENALSGVVSVVAATNPEAALGLARDITEDAARENALRVIATTMITREPDRFDEIVSSLGLSEATIAQLRSMKERAPRVLYSR